MDGILNFELLVTSIQMLKNIYLFSDLMLS